MTLVVNKPEDKGNNKTSGNSGNTEAIVKEIPKYTFPREFSHLVFLRRRKNGPPLPVEGEFIDESIAKLGPSFKGKTVLRGLATEEEERWLAGLVGASIKSPTWEERTLDYWKHIGRSIPPNNKDGSGGLELETGLKYKNQADFDEDQKRTKDENGVIVNPRGEPINLSDYIFWRLCLVHGMVANSYDLVNMSAKIQFYLFSKEKDLHDKKIMFQLTKKARTLLYQRMHERVWVDNMVRMLLQQDVAAQYPIKDVPRIPDDEKDIILAKYADDIPHVFINYGEDKHLEMKSFIEVCIAMGVLNRIPNTTSISIDGDTIGNTMQEAVIYLNDPANNSVLGRLKAQAIIKP